MRKKIVAGNWKMNKTHSEALALIKEINQHTVNDEVQLIVIPPSIYVSEVVNLAASNNVRVGVQNSSQYDGGAYTGELSSAMIKSVGAQFVLVGHSERREYFKEKNADLALKVDQLINDDLTPIYCCGEVLEDREAGNHFNFVKSQIEEGLFHLDETAILKIVIAYEPVWAIGTGVTASSDQAQEMHHFIRTLLTDKYGNDVANAISILYGGSCKPNIAQELFANSDVDGGLIGGASLNAQDFIAIANSF
ncbi:MAG: triose-phosphate isomerase [Flavobacteriales bacterium]|nr:MAG: triose-phosphate isomerase [Flavobacteriales bacterium]